jgi:hypothetical protein
MAMLSVKDKRDLQDVACLYVYYNVGFVSQQDGHQLIWRFDIELDELIKYSKNSTTYMPLPSKICEILSQKIQYEKLNSAQQLSTDLNTSKEHHETEQMQVAKAKQEEAIMLKNENERKLNAKIKDKPRTVKRDFFGRPIIIPRQPLNDDNEEATTTDSKQALQSEKCKPPSFPIRFQHNEGFTNAIRRPTKIEDFL